MRFVVDSTVRFLTMPNTIESLVQNKRFLRYVVIYLLHTR